MEHHKTTTAALVAAIISFTFLFTAVPLADIADADDPAGVFYFSADGSEWAAHTNVYTDLQTAINDASAWSASNANEQAFVLVAVGTYTLGFIELQNGVTVRGGFDGTEAGLIPTYQQDGDPAGLTNTVFIPSTSGINISDSGNGTPTLDNVVITGATSSAISFYRAANVVNCTITGCTSGMVIIYLSSGLGTIKFLNCSIVGNTASGLISATGSIAFISCTIQNNTVGLANIIVSSTSNSTFLNCTIISNTSTSCGGIYSMGYATLINTIVALNTPTTQTQTVAGGTLIAQSSVIGDQIYSADGLTHDTLSPAPDAADFDIDGSLMETATWAIGQGDVLLYMEHMDTALITLNPALGTSWTAETMRDMRDNPIITGDPGDQIIDLGAFSTGIDPEELEPDPTPNIFGVPWWVILSVVALAILGIFLIIKED